ncbi:hypothetical protein [Couchioplanes caeruleus]|uniref:Uncharacterized protein n=2 Tax=Couchioplanes caeruleus TaxID=56438 RepID=A0A1K0GI87_9ACTN|nr:hypothetical protein [Couchioplanes caeruleus]OJF11950.1 hypothetical protein BG844_23390 [Couchioplanes caeruleus subsp. caeruleus]ROP30398.1 short repeat uncharacterized protein predicted to be involved in signal transduction [Couchioplanes caeruleus]
MTSSIGALLTRGLLTAGLATAALTATLPAAAQAVSALPAGLSAAALADPSPNLYDEKMRVLAKFGLDDQLNLAERTDRDFVIALWTRIKNNPDHLEVRIAAEAAYSAAPEDAERACRQFILVDVYAAFDRDVAREKTETDEKRRSDFARATAAASIDVVADAAMLNGTDTKFIELIWQRADEDGKWPKVKAAARDARKGTPEQQREFIASGLAAAAKQDTDDRIAADAAKTEEEKAAARARAAKQFAANRIGLPVTEPLLSMPDRDFVNVVWNYAAEGTEVARAAERTARSNDPAVWKTFIDTGIHQAKDRDIKNALDKQEAEDRRRAREILSRAERIGHANLAAAARAALAGDAQAVADFVHAGQYQVRPDPIVAAPLALTGNRVGVITTDGTAHVKEGGLSTPWVTQHEGIRQLVLTGDRIGVLAGDGTAWVKEGGLGAGWVRMYDNVKQLAMSGNRIGVLTTDGTALVKEGGLGAQWVTEYTYVKHLVLAGNRIGVLGTDGTALVKEGDLSAFWVTEYEGVQQLVLTDNRIGVLTNDGTALVKEGGLSAFWVNEHGGVKQLVLSGDRIGIITHDGRAHVKEGGLSAFWVTQHDGIRQLALAGNRIGVLSPDGTARVKEGGLGAGWIVVRTGVGPEA